MPFIDSKITVKLSDDKKEAVKAKLGKAVSLLHKTESFLMVGIADNYDLWFAGEKLDKGAYVEVSLFGNASSSDYEKLTAEICRIYSDELDIHASAVYVTYHPITDWGWNGSNF